MDFLHIIWKSIIAVIFLFVLTKLMGQRQMSQMSMFDYICGISIGSIAAEAATNENSDYPLTLFAMALFAVVSIITSLITCKSLTLRKIINGNPIILYEKGKIYEKNLLTAKIDINEFLTQCRTQGYFNLNDIHTAILETNGQISILPMAQAQPLTPEDMNITVTEEKPCTNIILDGHVLEDNLKYSGNNDVWLKQQLEQQKINSVTEVFLATIDADNILTIYKKTNDKHQKDIFE